MLLLLLFVAAAPATTSAAQPAPRRSRAKSSTKTSSTAPEDEAAASAAAAAPSRAKLLAQALAKKEIAAHAPEAAASTLAAAAAAGASAAIAEPATTELDIPAAAAALDAAWESDQLYVGSQAQSDNLLMGGPAYDGAQVCVEAAGLTAALYSLVLACSCMSWRGTGARSKGSPLGRHLPTELLRGQSRINVIVMGCGTWRKVLVIA